MLDSGWHQGSSLLGQSSGQLRVLSVIPSGEVEDLHALWQACAALQAQGYPVMILDGLESETDQAPGLEDVLQGCSSTALPAHLTQPHAIASLPAARGLQELADWAQASGQPPLGQLYRHFRNHALLVNRSDGAYIDDLGSLNGTYVNRSRIESQKLEDGDEIQVGKYKLSYLEK